MPGEEAYVSLVTNDNYAVGALVLGQSLRDSLTQRNLSLLITNDVSHAMRERLKAVWDELTVVEEIDSEDTERLALLTRPELGVTFSKLHAWRLTQYSKCVFLDADTLVLENVDELFDREELSAAPDIGWPDCFNSGVFVYEPSMDTFSNLLAMAQQTGSFDGGDQGLFNLYWADWATKDIKFHLPFIYNMTPNAAYGYAPAFQRFGRNAKIIHFIGPVKPWHHQYVSGVDSIVFAPGTYSSQSSAYDFVRRWWHVYNRMQQPSSTHIYGAAPPGPPPPPLPLTSTTSCPTLYYHSCPPHHHLVTSFLKSTFVRPSFSSPSSPLSSSHFSLLHAPPSTPVDFRSPSPALSWEEDGTENDDTDTVLQPSSDSVHQIHPLSPPSPLPSSPPVNFQTQETDNFSEGISETEGGAVYNPLGKSKEQLDIEQGRIDYTGKHRSDMVIEALNGHLNDD